MLPGRFTLIAAKSLFSLAINTGSRGGCARYCGRGGAFATWHAPYH